MNTHTDERGMIDDLKVGDDYSITFISFKKDAVRGNHYHKKTTQIDVILKGKLIDAKGNILEAGDKVKYGFSEPHAYRAIEDSEIVSICIGERIGENYENDTYRLETPLL